MPEEHEDEGVVKVNQPDESQPRPRPKKIVIPKRAKSKVILQRTPVYITADKMTCDKCPCFPQEDPYRKPKKLSPCQSSPLTLYELSAAVVNGLQLPAAFVWTRDEVADWMEHVVGLPEYRDSIVANHIDGMRLLMFEDASKCPAINIHDFQHIQIITSKIREQFTTEVIQFARSVGLPPRKPLTHCTWFKSRTGPSWGIRQNWNRCDILRWMKIIMPEPIQRNHWDLVWHLKPDFPKVLFGKASKPQSQVHIPHYKPYVDVCPEYTAPRKFRIQNCIAEEDQYIWMEHRPGSPFFGELKKKKKKPTSQKESRLMLKKVDLTGLSGKELLLARRKMNKPKFLPTAKVVKEKKVN